MKSAKPKNHAKTIRLAVLVCCGIAMAVTVVLNWQPYLGIARTLVESITEVPLIDLLMMLPIVGSLLSLIAVVISQIFGIALWGIIQILEILPAWMKGELNALVGLIYGMSNIPQMAITDRDSEAVVKLKEQFNSAPNRWLKTAQQMAVGAYLVDAVLCLLRFPPYAGGFPQFWEDLQLGVATIDAIQWNNMISAVATMFGFEAVLYLLVWISQGMRYFMTPPGGGSGSRPGGPNPGYGPGPRPGAAPGYSQPGAQSPKYAQPPRR